ncbi:MAG: hypothetical protein HYS08_06335 [Chlamydiae bacterium]|nr:hypothetical protein [Chlamydiota bacterium]MBI3266996.1 hypothetical protein [Chlamydiota bacterium]
MNTTSFKFSTSLDLTETLGRRAKNLQELLLHLKEVPPSSVYYHTHRFLQQHQYLSPEPPNDFAYWVKNVLGDKVLGEKLFSIDILQFGDIESLRKEIVRTLEEYINLSPDALMRFASLGHEFYFMKSVQFILPLPYEAHSLEEFNEILRQVTIYSIYYHMFDARLRLGKNDNDFSMWLKSCVREEKLAKQISKLDPYTHTLEELRTKICSLAEERLHA